MPGWGGAGGGARPRGIGRVRGQSSGAPASQWPGLAWPGLAWLPKRGLDFCAAPAFFPRWRGPRRPRPPPPARGPGLTRCAASGVAGWPRNGPARDNGHAGPCLRSGAFSEKDAEL